jgi:hypothetical protein
MLLDRSSARERSRIEAKIAAADTRPYGLLRKNRIEQEMDKANVFSLAGMRMPVISIICNGPRHITVLCDSHRQGVVIGQKASRKDKIMNFWLISILLILSAYIFSLIYLNTKVRSNEKKPSDIPPVESKEDQIPDNLRPLKASISLMGGLVLGILILMMLGFAIGVIFFRDEFLPR